jgi:hypothetical protein
MSQTSGSLWLLYPCALYKLHYSQNCRANPKVFVITQMTAVLVDDVGRGSKYCQCARKLCSAVVNLNYQGGDVQQINYPPMPPVLATTHIRSDLSAQLD